jgi:hypothetical protein
MGRQPADIWAGQDPEKTCCCPVGYIDTASRALVRQQRVSPSANESAGCQHLAEPNPSVPIPLLGRSDS